MHRKLHTVTIMLQHQIHNLNSQLVIGDPPLVPKVCGNLRCPAIPVDCTSRPMRKPFSEWSFLDLYRTPPSLTLQILRRRILSCYHSRRIDCNRFRKLWASTSSLVACNWARVSLILNGTLSFRCFLHERSSPQNSCTSRRNPRK